jgi:hypothetical protein
MFRISWREGGQETVGDARAVRSPRWSLDPSGDDPAVGCVIAFPSSSDALDSHRVLGAVSSGGCPAASFNTRPKRVRRGKACAAATPPLAKHVVQRVRENRR